MTVDPKALDLIREGIDLIEASQLACWEGRFVSQEQDVFDAYWPRMHPRFGRWFCWLAFGVGAECVLRGSHEVKNLQFIIRKPKWAELGVPEEQITVLNNRIRNLANRRNEGAHRYIAGIRNEYFPEVENEYVPALNFVLDVIGYPRD